MVGETVPELSQLTCSKVEYVPGIPITDTRHQDVLLLGGRREPWASVVYVVRMQESRVILAGVMLIFSMPRYCSVRFIINVCTNERTVELLPLYGSSSDGEVSGGWKERRALESGDLSEHYYATNIPLALFILRPVCRTRNVRSEVRLGRHPDI